MGDDVLRQAEEIVEGAVRSHALAERLIAARIADSVATGRAWRCRACDAYFPSTLWPRPAYGLCVWCSPSA